MKCKRLPWIHRQLLTQHFCRCFICIYQMLTALFGWIPSYQFTFGVLRASTLGFPSSSSGPESQTSNAAKPSLTDLFNDKYTIDVCVYYVCSTVLAGVLLALADSVRARALLSPAFNRILTMLTFCPTPDSLKQPSLPASIADEDVRYVSICLLI
jgi:hypothetical protein